MRYDELFEELFTMTSDEDFDNFTMHLYNSQSITDAEACELWDMACDIHRRYVA